MFPTYSGQMGVEKSLSQAEEELNGIAMECNDFVVDTLDFRYDGVDIRTGGEGKYFGFTDTGLDQFGRFLGVKAHFFKKLKSETRKAVFDDVRVDAHDIQKDAKVRIYKSDVRAILGSHYAPISGKMLINELRNAGFEDKSLSLRLFADYESTDLIVLSREKIAGTPEGESLFPGLIMRNDDVGRQSASIQCFLHNSTLAYGIIFGQKNSSKFKYNHTKNVEEHFAEGIVFSVGRIVDWFANSGIQIEKLMRTKALEVERLLPVLKSTLIRDKEVEAMVTMEKLKSGNGYSLWDLITTISLYATSIEDRVRTFDLMQIAGDIMNSPKPFAINWEE